MWRIVSDPASVSGEDIGNVFFTDRNNNGEYMTRERRKMAGAWAEEGLIPWDEGDLSSDEQAEPVTAWGRWTAECEAQGPSRGGQGDDFIGFHAGVDEVMDAAAEGTASEDDDVCEMGDEVSLEDLFGPNDSE